MDDCLFCKIIKKEIPSDIIFENDNILALLDITPCNPGHTLIIPKDHSDNFTEMSDELAGKLIITAKNLASKIIKAVNAPAFNLITNTGKESGQNIFHTHFHIVPRFDSKEVPDWPHKDMTEEEKLEVKNRIVSFLKE